jgi:hypothetical protein
MGYIFSYTSLEGLIIQFLYGIDRFPSWRLGESVSPSSCNVPKRLKGNLMSTQHCAIILPDKKSEKATSPKMLKSIKITGYRGFSEFEMSNLGRVNLLVGKNNSGKTTALEGLYLLASRGTPYSVWNVLWRRGERMADRNPENYPQTAVCHLFHGHTSPVGSKFSFIAQNETPTRQLTFSIGGIADDQQKKEITRGGIPVPVRVGLHIKGTPSPVVDVIPLSRTGGMSSETLDTGRRRPHNALVDDDMPTRFITTESVSIDDLIAVWDRIALTPYEERVHRAIRLLEPNIERIAPLAARTTYYQGPDRGGFIVKMKDIENPIPIGSMGDGMWRIMTMAISLAQCTNGVLLIDEIDTGLHYSVMTDMWKLIYGAALELNVQVFASTHSNDCLRSLAEFCFEDSDAAKDVTLQRIEQGKKKSVPYSAKEIEISAEKQIEVR